MKNLIWGYLSKYLKYKIIWNPFYNKRIAVVGNAKSLFDKKYGELIDSYDVVCRFNRGNKIIDVESQGTKTTVRFFSVPTLSEFEDIISEYADDTQIIHISNRGRKRFISPLETIFIPKLFNKYIASVVKVKRPSSGLMALNYIEFCDPLEITLFGFDWKKTATYYDENRTEEPHDFEKEEQYILEHLLTQKKFNRKF